MCSSSSRSSGRKHPSCQLLRCSAHLACRSGRADNCMSKCSALCNIKAASWAELRSWQHDKDEFNLAWQASATLPALVLLGEAASEAGLPPSVDVAVDLLPFDMSLSDQQLRWMAAIAAALPEPQPDDAAAADEPQPAAANDGPGSPESGTSPRQPEGSLWLHLHGQNLQRKTAMIIIAAKADQRLCGHQAGVQAFGWAAWQFLTNEAPGVPAALQQPEALAMSLSVKLQGMAVVRTP